MNDSALLWIGKQLTRGAAIMIAAMPVYAMGYDEYFAGSVTIESYKSEYDANGKQVISQLRLHSESEDGIIEPEDDYEPAEPRQNGAQEGTGVKVQYPTFI